MTVENWLVLAILTGAVILFVSEKLRVDLVALLVLLFLMLTGLATPEEAFSGFSSPAVITVWAVFIVSGGLTRSGIADLIAQWMLRLAGRDPVRLTVMVMLAVGLMSAFMNNIGAVAILLPAVVSVAREMKVAPSKLLIPLAWASLMGGNMTLIGTPPNILASSILEQYGGLDSFTFFDFLPTGIIILTTGILYMVLVGRHLIPARTTSADLEQDYPIRQYLSEVRVETDSPLVGQTIQQARLGEQYDLNVIHIHPTGEDGASSPSLVDHRLSPGDSLLIEARADAIIEAGKLLALAPAPAQALRQTRNGEELQLAEVVIGPNSSLSGQTLRQIDFRARFGLSVMAIRHHGRTRVFGLSETPLAFGDALLIEGPPERLSLLRRDPDFMVLEPPKLEMRRREKAPYAVAVLAGVLAAVTTGILSVPTAMLAGAVLMVITGALSMDEAYQAIEWKSVFLIAGMLPLGLVMETTGTARLLADQIVLLVGDWGALAVVMGIFLLTALLTEVMSNAAATVLVVPIAIDAARSLSADPHAFVMAVVLAASTSFLMPIGHQVNVLVYGPGGYRFTDYTRVGVWLNILLFFVVALTLPLIWPLY